MAQIVFNEALGADLFLLRLKGKFEGKMGQFYMLRSREPYPLLSRPISIYDIDDTGITFLYRRMGKGTSHFANCQKGDEIILHGPYGNGFPFVTGRIALVGGGIGAAPLYLAYKTLMKNPDNHCDLYVGFREQHEGIRLFQQLNPQTQVDIGGFVTDRVKPSDYDFILSCGPEIMMGTLEKKRKETKAVHYVSVEKRMACGVGACLVCSCQVGGQNKRACKEGPVFLAEEVFDERA